MARKRKKISLYEVISRDTSKSAYGRMLEKLHLPKIGRDKPAAAQDEVEMPERAAEWPRKPKIVQFNAGRIEFSMPYQIAIAVLLGIILLLLVVFRLGQRASNPKITSFSTSRQDVKTSPARPKAADLPAVKEVTPVADIDKSAISADKPAAIKTDWMDGLLKTKAAGPLIADNVIVLVEYKAKADLVPVQEHFASYGIGTEIIIENGRYFLITKDRYEKNPDKPGTAGYRAKQKIIKVGAQYKNKAPKGYETFAPHFFRDAYGKKLK